jgi:hypothetical protein
MVITLKQPAGDSGVETEQGYHGKPNDEGVLKDYVIEIADFEKGCYYAAYQKYDPVKSEFDIWPDGTNRIQPLRIFDFRNLKNGGMFLLLQLTNGKFLSLLPLAGRQTIAWFASADGKLVLNVGTLGSGQVKGDLPLLAWAKADDPYKACHHVWERAIKHELIGNSTKLREQKPYPEILRYLGWCSWEEYHEDIDEETLLRDIESIEHSDLPIRYVLIDDGHLDEKDRQLKSFRPNKKFPSGWSRLLSRRRPDKIKWMGLWLNFNGYWLGVDPENKLNNLNEHLETVVLTQLEPAVKLNQKALLPKQGLEHSVSFYNGLIGAAGEAGFDFVKVDNQARNFRIYQGTEQPVVCAANNCKALEIACARYMRGLINCMAHNSICIFNTMISAVTRCSEDYLWGDLAWAKRHLHNSYGNIAWLGQTVWGDHDMFHSNDPVCGQVMSVSKALSGGPIYLSDLPSAIVAEYVWPLCYKNGQLLRPLAPAVPLPESLFLDPFAENKPFRVIAPLANNSAVIAAYNLTEPETAVSGSVSADDYKYATAMLQENDEELKLPQQGLLVYDWYAEKATVLEDRYKFSLEKFGDLLLLLCPIHCGWSVIGRPDKFLSTAAVEVIQYLPNELLLRMKESGPLRIWNKTGAIACSNGYEIKSFGSGLWQVEPPVGRHNMLVKLTLRA